MAKKIMVENKEIKKRLEEGTLANAIERQIVRCLDCEHVMIDSDHFHCMNEDNFGGILQCPIHDDSPPIRDGAEGD